jgi:hypothetical protein
LAYLIKAFPTNNRPGSKAGHPVLQWCGTYEEDEVADGYVFAVGELEALVGIAFPEAHAQDAPLQSQLHLEGREQQRLVRLHELPILIDVEKLSGVLDLLQVGRDAVYRGQESAKKAKQRVR